MFQFSLEYMSQKVHIFVCLKSCKVFLYLTEGIQELLNQMNHFTNVSNGGLLP